MEQVWRQNELSGVERPVHRVATNSSHLVKKNDHLEFVLWNLSALKEFILCEREINPELTKVQPFYWMGDRLCDIYIAGTCLALAALLLQTPFEATTG